MTKCLISWSSGKDSAWMVHVLRQRSDITLGGLLTTINEPARRVAMHAVRVDLLRAQAEALALPLWLAPIPSPCPNEIYEAVMRGVVSRAIADGFTHMAFADLYLQDIRRYREEKLAGTGLTPLFPLWGRPTRALAEEMIAVGQQAVLTCVDPRALPRAFAGRAFDAALLRDLPAEVDPCGERGEFHSFAWDGPAFRHPVPVRVGEVVDRDGFVFADLLPGAGGGSGDEVSPGSGNGARHCA